MKLQIRKRVIISVVILVILSVALVYIKSQYVVPIIMYHSIDDKAAVSKTSVCPESFKRQMYFLKRHNYNVVRLEELPDLMKQGRIPSRTIVITFDDGYENNYMCAYPVLRELALPATIFIAPALIGRENYLTWGQIIEMSESGLISIGSHSMTHAYLVELPEEELEIEITGSKRSIEDHINRPVYSFSYPLGSFNEYVKEKVRKAGYKIAVGTNPGRAYPKHDLFAMKRLRISKTSDNLFAFWVEISGFYTWLKEHRDED
jgi:peptidoglycan/xylan/chitin deacetylase (PgdA/CDA1 family)